MKRGFTLIELICCILILTIISLFSMPSIIYMKNKIGKTTFQKTSEELLKDLRYSRIRAMTSGGIKVHFYDDGYTLYDYSAASTIFKTVVYEKGIKFVKYKSTIPDHRELTFKETGTVSPYACTIVLEDAKGASCSISIKVATFTIDYKR